MTAIKVEKETSVSANVRFAYLSLIIRRARSMSNSMPSKMPRRPFKGLMAVGLVDDKYQPLSSLTLSCKPINRIFKTWAKQTQEDIPLNDSFLL